MNDQERIEYFMAEIARLSNQVVDLQNERDGLAAKLQNIDNAWIATGCWPTTVEEKQALANAINAEPQQCLAEIRAEAGRAGFIAGISESIECPEKEVEWMYRDEANQYAAKVRQGEKGTWLKDSNVNGGKRQGGE